MRRTIFFLFIALPKTSSLRRIFKRNNSFSQINFSFVIINLKFWHFQNVLCFVIRCPAAICDHDLDFDIHFHVIIHANTPCGFFFFTHYTDLNLMWHDFWRIFFPWIKIFRVNWSLESNLHWIIFQLCLHFFFLLSHFIFNAIVFFIEFKITVNRFMCRMKLFAHWILCSSEMWRRINDEKKKKKRNIQNRNKKKRNTLIHRCILEYVRFIFLWILYPTCMLFIYIRVLTTIEIQRFFMMPSISQKSIFWLCLCPASKRN